MSKPIYYPPARYLGDGVSGGSWKPGLAPDSYKLCLHTTETARGGVPGYNDGKSAPHLTYVEDWNVPWVQHTPFDTAARALVNGPDPRQTNRDQLIQVEIVCYSNRFIANLSGKRTWVGDLSDRAYEDLADLVVWLHANYNVQIDWPGRQAYTYSQANAPGFRMPMSLFDQYGGILAHQHVGDGNTHWDTGAFLWEKLIQKSLERTDEDMQILVSGQGTRLVQASLNLWADHRKVDLSPENPSQLGIFVDSQPGPETEVALQTFRAWHGQPEPANSLAVGGVDGLILGSYLTPVIHDRIATDDELNASWEDLKQELTQLEAEQAAAVAALSASLADHVNSDHSGLQLPVDVRLEGELSLTKS